MSDADFAGTGPHAQDGPQPTSNKVVCPRCGRVRLETPPGTTVLPTLGMARKASGVAGECDCGRAPHERPEVIAHEPGAPGGPGSSTGEGERSEPVGGDPTGEG